MKITHIYSQTGAYTVSLTVTDDDGATNTDISIVTVASISLPDNPGDINGDNEVDLLDILMIIEHFGKTSGFDEKVDLNNDGVINLSDILEVVKNWGKVYN